MEVIRTVNGEFKNEVRFDHGEIDELMQNHYYAFQGEKFSMDTPALDLDSFFESEKHLKKRVMTHGVVIFSQQKLKETIFRGMY